MNLSRSLSNHQLFYLKLICSGKMVLTYCEDHNRFCEKTGYGCLVYGASKPQGKHIIKCGFHKDSSIIELIQRELLVNIDGRLMPNKEAARQFGSPPALATQPRKVVMSRTRAARIQNGGSL